MSSTRPAVATTSPSQRPRPPRSVVDRLTAGSLNIRFATTTPTSPPKSCAPTSVIAWRPGSAPVRRSRAVTTGLNAADTGCRAMISAASAAPVANAFSSSCSPTSLGDSRCAAIPEPTTAATRKAVPTSSATARCRRGGPPPESSGIDSGRRSRACRCRSGCCDRLCGLEDRAVHAVSGLMSEPNRGVDKPGSCQAFEVFGPR